MKRDSQRGALYDWENIVVRAFCPEVLTEQLYLPECEALINEVLGDYRRLFEPVILGDGRGRRSAVAIGTRYVKLPTWTRNRLYILHETAHLLTFIGPPHGPHFARLLLEFISHYLDVPKKSARALGVNQRPRRVRFAPPGQVAQPVRRRRKWLRLKAAKGD